MEKKIKAIYYKTILIPFFLSCIGNSHLIGGEDQQDEEALGRRKKKKSVIFIPKEKVFVKRRRMNGTLESDFILICIYFDIIMSCLEFLNYYYYHCIQEQLFLFLKFVTPYIILSYIIIIVLFLCCDSM